MGRFSFQGYLDRPADPVDLDDLSTCCAFEQPHACDASVVGR
jgi:hypothetical protein